MVGFYRDSLLKSGSLPIRQTVSYVHCKSTQEGKMAANLNTALVIVLFRTLLAIYRGKSIIFCDNSFLLLSDWPQICLPITFISVELGIQAGQIFQLLGVQKFNLYFGILQSAYKTVSQSSVEKSSRLS